MRYMFVKGIKQENSTLKYFMLKYAIEPLWLLSKREFNQIIPIFQGNQKEYSLLFKQFQEYIKSNNKRLG